MFDLKKLLVDVFDPQEGEKVTVMVDVPREGVADDEGWKARRLMAAEWRDTLEELGADRGFSVNSLLEFPATGGNNADLPSTGQQAGNEVDLTAALQASTLVLAMTQFSATAPLAHLADDNEDFRAASMPGVEKRMEGTALAADYSKVAARCAAIEDIMQGAVLCEVIFSTGPVGCHPASSRKLAALARDSPTSGTTGSLPERSRYSRQTSSILSVSRAWMSGAPGRRTRAISAITSRQPGIR